MSKVLVTGASGFIGKALVSRLKALGRKVVPIDSASGDIADPETLDRFSQPNIAHVFHLAGRTFVPDSWHDPLSFGKTNVLGAINVLEFCRKNNASLTYVSAYIYGHPETLPIGEDSQIKPSNPYALTKRLAEEACEFYAAAYGMKVTTIRPFNVYGIGQGANFLIPLIIEQALTGSQIVVKDLLPKRDYVYLDDLTKALLATLDTNAENYNVINIGSGTSLSVKEVIDVVQDVAGTSKEIVSNKQVRANELMDVIADISKAKTILGWQPEYSFRDGIEKIIHLEQRKVKI